MFSLLKLLVLSILLTLCACTATKSTGGVNITVVDYERLKSVKDVKSVVYDCDYGRVVSQDFIVFGDYCGVSETSDYISYFIPPDIQSTVGHGLYLVQNYLNDIEMSYSNYYYIYITNASFESVNKVSNDIKNELEKYAKRSRMINLNALLNVNSPATSFVIKGGDTISIGISKKDLVSRLYIYPSLAIRSLSLKDSIKNIDKVLMRDYQVSYQILPYMFTTTISSDAMASLLGLPYYGTGYLSSDQRGELDSISNDIEKYWSYENKPLGDSLLNSRAVPILDKGTDALLLNDLLPAYELEKIDIYSKGDLLRTYSKDTLLSTVISVNREMLLFQGSVKDLTDISIRYLYIAKQPAMHSREDISSVLRSQLGVDYIYSDIADTIEVVLNVKDIYDIKSLPLHCVNILKFKRLMHDKGYADEEIDVIIGYIGTKGDSSVQKLPPLSNADSCTYVESTLANYLHLLY